MNINSNKSHQHPIYFDKISVQYIATAPGGINKATLNPMAINYFLKQDK